MDEKQILGDRKKTKPMRSGLLFVISLLTVIGAYAGFESVGLDPSGHLIYFLSGKPYITQEERERRSINSRTEKLFNYDLDDNGFISRQEYRKYLEENF